MKSKSIDGISDNRDAHIQPRIKYNIFLDRWNENSRWKTTHIKRYYLY